MSLKKKINVAGWLLRQSVFGLFMKPSFIIIGAQKSGTTSLYTYLSKHPAIVQPATKEIHYFNGGLHPSKDHYKKGRPWYQAHFPPRLLYRNRMTFEASPVYLFHPHVPQRIHHFNPNIRLVALLRNPTERAISQYFMNLRKGFDNRPIMQALEEEDLTMRQCIEDGNFDNRDFTLFSYKYRGHYADQVRNYLRYFNLDQMLILNSEQLFTKPEQSLEKVFNFLGVESGVELDNIQPTNTGDNKASVSTEVYKYLQRYFDPLNEDLYKLIGKRFEW